MKKKSFALWLLAVHESPATKYQGSKPKSSITSTRSRVPCASGLAGSLGRALWSLASSSCSAADCGSGCQAALAPNSALQFAHAPAVTAIAALQFGHSAMGYLLFLLPPVMPVVDGSTKESSPK